MYPFWISNFKKKEKHVFFIRMWQQIWKSCSLCYPSHCTISYIFKKKHNKTLHSSTLDRSCAGWRVGREHRPLRCRWHVDVQRRSAWLRQFQVPVITRVQPNNLKLPTSHRSGVKDRAADTEGGGWDSSARLTERSTKRSIKKKKSGRIRFGLGIENWI